MQLAGLMEAYVALLLLEASGLMAGRPTPGTRVDADGILGPCFRDWLHAGFDP